MGPKFWSQIVSCHPRMMLSYVFWGFVLQKMEKISKNRPFWYFWPLNSINCQNDLFCWFSPLFAKQTAQTHKITSYGDGMTKILRPKFRSHGTNLGSLGLISQKATGKTFSKYLCPIIWDLYECPILLESHGPLKKLVTFRSQCEA